MKKNIPQDNFLFKLDTNLIDDINCLLTFVRQPLRLDEFFKKIPSDILQAKLGELEFKLENRENPPYFLIILKNSNKVSQFKLTNNHLSSLGIAITDQNQLIAPLLATKNQTPKSSLKDLFTILIEGANNINKKLNLDNASSFIKDKTLSLPENKNKQTEINIFFNLIEKFLIQEKDCKNPNIIITAQSLLIVANDLSKLELRYPDLNTLISEIHTNLNKFTSNDISITTVLLAYEKLHYKTTLILPEVEKSKISSLIDILIRIKADNSITNSNFNFFRLSFLEKKGFRYIFGSEEDINFYEAVQKNYKNFSSLKKPFLEIVNLIHKLYFSSDKNQKIIDLLKQLDDLTNLYFQTILDISNSNTNENLKERKKEAFTKFQNKVKEKIMEFKEENLKNLKQLDTLYKILNYIAKLIPSFILSKDRRISFFQSRTSQNKKIDPILDEIQNKFIYSR